MAKSKKTPQHNPLICRNARATHRFQIDETLEVGVVLQGSEVKSLRARRGDLERAYANVVGDELYLHQMHIAPYEQARAYGHEPLQVRKLLAHRHEIERLRGRLATRGYTLIPLCAYFKGGRVKVELGLARAKNVGDKRESLRREQDLREAKQAMDHVTKGGR